MTFRDVVIKTFKKNVRSYSSYFLCSCFTIMIFFMYTTMYFNKYVKKSDDNGLLTYVLPITIVAISAFSVFFISYAYRTFIKGRNKEFGIYMSLGMNEDDIKRLVLIENIIISGCSLIVGILVGTLLSRLFQMVILSMMEVENIRYSLTIWSFVVTALVYIVIFAIVIVNTNHRMKKMSIQTLLKDARQREGIGYKRIDGVLGVLGILIMILSVISVAIIANNDKMNSNPAILACYMGVSFLGLYLVISHGGNFVIHLIKKSRKYYQNLISVTQIHYKFNQNKKIIFILSILSTMTIFLVASPFALLNLTEDITLLNPHNIEISEGKDAYQVTKEELTQTFSKYTIKKSIDIPYLLGNVTITGKEEQPILNKPILSVTDYNEAMNEKSKVNKGCAIHYILTWTPGLHGITPNEKYSVTVGSTSLEVMMLDSCRAPWNTASFGNEGMIVLNDEDYASLNATITKDSQYIFHALELKDWKDTEDTVNQLKAKVDNGSKYEVYSSILCYEDLKKGYSVFLFVTTVLGILFFVASGSVLYFKQFTEIGEMKKTFFKLYKIGITKKEISKVISKELLVVFYMPLIFGSYMGVSIMYLMTFIVGGGNVIKPFMKSAVVVILLYFILQSMFYFITKRKYMMELTSEE